MTTANANSRADRELTTDFRARQRARLAEALLAGALRLVSYADETAISKPVN